MAALDFQCGDFFFRKRNALLRPGNGRCGLDGTLKDHRHAIGDAALNAAGMVREGTDRSVFHRIGIIALAAS